MRTLADHIGHAFELYFLFDPHLSPNRKLLPPTRSMDSLYTIPHLLPINVSANILPGRILSSFCLILWFFAQF